jgi:GWxTD domain-containing protein
LRFKVVNAGDSLFALYELKARGPVAIDDVTLEWENRESYGQRKGAPLSVRPQVLLNEPKLQIGRFAFPRPASPWLLTVFVKNNKSQQSWLYFKQIEANYPVDAWLGDAVPWFDSYVPLDKSLSIRYKSFRGTVNLFRYTTDFPAASPPFAEKENRVAPLLKADSLIRWQTTQPLPPLRPGLYLAQVDSTSAFGMAFRVAEASYPRYTQIEDLAPPLIFVCTPEEFAQLRKAGGNKKEFDKVILEITRDAERARNFMRSYFRRVELANHYFTSYKEGWKTDRGMIYLIFGAPSEVVRTTDSENWNYKNHKVRFTFVKTGTLYDPDNFILVRDKRFAETWYSIIDLWRKSRF